MICYRQVLPFTPNNNPLMSKYVVFYTTYIYIYIYVCVIFTIKIVVFTALSLLFNLYNTMGCLVLRFY